MNEELKNNYEVNSKVMNACYALESICATLVVLYLATGGNKMFDPFIFVAAIISPVVIILHILFKMRLKKAFVADSRKWEFNELSNLIEEYPLLIHVSNSLMKGFKRRYLVEGGANERKIIVRARMIYVLWVYLLLFSVIIIYISITTPDTLANAFK
jgi:hypothetical protein